MYDVGDVVVVEGRFVGTFTGPLAGLDGDIEPTGATFDLRFADVSLGRGAGSSRTTPTTTNSVCSRNWASWRRKRAPGYAGNSLPLQDTCSVRHLASSLHSRVFTGALENRRDGVCGLPLHGALRRAPPNDPPTAFPSNLRGVIGIAGTRTRGIQSARPHPSPPACSIARGGVCYGWQMKIQFWGRGESTMSTLLNPASSSIERASSAPHTVPSPAPSSAKETVRQCIVLIP